SGGSVADHGLAVPVISGTIYMDGRGHLGLHHSFVAAGWHRPAGMIRRAATSAMDASPARGDARQHVPARCCGYRLNQIGFTSPGGRIMAIGPVQLIVL